jgi:hypothetical protein
MSKTDKTLCAAYLVIAIVALYATWVTPDNGGLPGFIAACYVNPAAASITNDILFFALAATIFMVVEARRLGIRFVWIYVVLSSLIAVSVMFPLFLIARQLRLSEHAHAGPTSS